MRLYEHIMTKSKGLHDMMQEYRIYPSWMTLKPNECLKRYLFSQPRWVVPALASGTVPSPAALNMSDHVEERK